MFRFMTALFVGFCCFVGIANAELGLGVTSPKTGQDIGPMAVEVSGTSQEAVQIDVTVWNAKGDVIYGMGQCRPNNNGDWSIEIDISSAMDVLQSGDPIYVTVVASKFFPVQTFSVDITCSYTYNF